MCCRHIWNHCKNTTKKPRLANLPIVITLFYISLTKSVTTQVGLSYSPMHNFPRCNQRVNRFFTKYEAVYNVSMLGLSCAINCNSRNGERSCFLAVSVTECITAYASAPRNVRKSPATFCFVFAGLTARSIALLSYGTSGLSRKVKI